MMERSQKHQHVMPRRADGTVCTRHAWWVMAGRTARSRSRMASRGLWPLVRWHTTSAGVQPCSSVMVGSAPMAMSSRTASTCTTSHHPPSVSTCKRAGQRGPPPSPALWRVGSSRAGCML